MTRFSLWFGVAACLLATQSAAQDRAVVAFVGDVMLARTEATGRLIAHGGDPFRRVRGILLAALAYFVLPFDAIPDLLAVVGFSDDIAVLAAAMLAWVAFQKLGRRQG